MANCKPGDIAIIVNSKYNSGKFVRVIRQLGTAPYLNLRPDGRGFVYSSPGVPDGTVVWEVENQLPLIVSGIEHSMLHGEREFRFEMPPGTNGYIDCNLKPIRPEDLDETTETTNELRIPSTELV